MVLAGFQFLARPTYNDLIKQGFQLFLTAKTDKSWFFHNPAILKGSALMNIKFNVYEYQK